MMAVVLPFPLVLLFLFHVSWLRCELGRLFVVLHRHISEFLTSILTEKDQRRQGWVVSVPAKEKGREKLRGKCKEWI
ncbi:hypothetical protein POPTR_002G200150v4 [Populus trichocarpa]|uniref:Uncharacterized protein n=2 Tax=Populus trichocarpa TaxID=3694 RepID=A0ACC0TFB9_POPTR|nr:hypothetical protein BDE02_02G182800 [Populus trichocarpa]KAI5599203.1 hypothetical protein BDE02_02G182800 [Populus trichocarpa]KAI5599204.1 hypothetical protein BDE02_02G182800 [Populus trichocarpa]KAI9400138.1 hypothetical protein POPTR_002G200150v4 [Populus trichocarpa]KAI9400139.1 hypothetical protein POPTR_002G200150v4 [Populus trichocarpa]